MTLFARRPSREAISHFVRDSPDLPLSYGSIGIVTGETLCRDLEEAIVTIGRGRTDFGRARATLVAWKQLEIGWIETLPRHAPVAVETVVAAFIQHPGFRSLNGCRVPHDVGGGGRFGFAYGTLTNHAESGEEPFDVFLDPDRDEVRYRIRATSEPQTPLARIGEPIVRVLQARLRCGSAAVIEHATKEFGW